MTAVEAVRGQAFEHIGVGIFSFEFRHGRVGIERRAAGNVGEADIREADAFGIEVNESVMAAKNLMTEFGLSGEQAMDFVAKGMQSGLNASGDFIDSISEYGNLFADAGFSADQMYSIMATGAETTIPEAQLPEHIRPNR